MQQDALLLLDELCRIVGGRHVLTAVKRTLRYQSGYRSGGGTALAVVRPGTLVELWRVLNAVVSAGRVVIMQAANTGLTGGSTPDGDEYDREVVVINTMRISGIQLINAGGQVVCLPGATLHGLENALSPLGREPHSVIGSSCIGASVLGGICNNSGGALVRRGPAYTQLALFARVTDEGKVELVNRLGINLGSDPEEILARLQTAQYEPADIRNGAEFKASDMGYGERVADVDADSPARYNADPERLFDASGSAGRVCVFAVRLDTYLKEASSVLYVGTNDPAELTELRRRLLTRLPKLPIAGEYIHKTAYDIGAKYGKDTFLFIEKLGTARVPKFFALKSRLDASLNRIGLRGWSDRAIQRVVEWLPHHLPPRMDEWRRRFEHHLVIRVSDDTLGEARQLLDGIFRGSASGDYFLCSEEEGRKAFLHRFAVAGAAVRYRAVHSDTVEDILALDIALRRSDRQWMELLPPEVEAAVDLKLYYGHFFCHVFHQDYAVKKGHDPIAVEHQMWRLLDARGAKYPAEHNVGHLYPAEKPLADFYKALDPTNSLNPGIGQTSKLRCWGECCKA